MPFYQMHKNSLISQLQAALEAARNMPVDRSCQDCTHYHANGVFPAKCMLFNASPPPEVIAVGCDKHLFDPTIPFYK